VLSAANAGDSIRLDAVLDDIPPIRMPTGRRRRRPSKIQADKADDHRRCRAYLRQRGIRPRIARRMIDSSQRLGRHRWTIQRTGAWLGGWRLRIRYERCSERFHALLRAGAAGLLGHLLRHAPAAAVAMRPRRCRAYLSGRGIKVRIARCGIESSQRLGRHRWKAERSIAWLAGVGACASATTGTPNGSSPSPCWPATDCRYHRPPCATTRLP
jgi:hypothetical protein